MAARGDAETPFKAPVSGARQHAQRAVVPVVDDQVDGPVAIEIGAGNASARGRWIMLQASRYADGSAELIAARLTIDFAPASDGTAWLIRHFRTERVLDGPWPLAAAPRS